MRSFTRSIRSTCIAALFVAGSVPAGDLDWQPVAIETLEELRGGFEAPAGIQASFGIERASYVNGELVTKMSVYVPDISKMTVEQATELDHAINSVVLIQNGPNNTFDIGSAAPGATIIQNTLNDQHIVTLTTISADVNTLALYQGLNMQDSMELALGKVAGMR